MLEENFEIDWIIYDAEGVVDFELKGENMFEVNWCVVGQDPDTEPFIFSTATEARKFLSDELWFFGRNTDDDEAMNDLHAWAYKLMEKNGQSDISFVAGGVAYWIKEMNLKDSDLSVLERYRL